MTTTDEPSPEPSRALNRAEARRSARGEKAPLARPIERMRELDLLRFVAALSVVLFHYTARENPAWGGENPIEVFPLFSQASRYGFMGVELFFMISGFVIVMTVWRRGVGEFAIARITRLFPAYVFAVVFTAVVVSLFGSLDYSVTPLQVLTNLTMIQSSLGVPDVDGVYWSLFVELRFYVLIAVLVVYGVTYRSVVGFMAIWLVMTVALRAAPVAFLDFFFFPRWSHYFIAGMAFFLIRKYGSNLLLWSMVFVCWILAMTKVNEEVIGAESIVRGDISPVTQSILTTAVYALMALVALGAFRWLSPVKWLTAVGLLTYPLYLLHEWIGWIFIDHLYPTLGRWPTLILVTTGMVALSYGVARFVEAPLATRTRAALNRTLLDMRADEAGAGRPAS